MVQWVCVFVSKYVHGQLQYMKSCYRTLSQLTSKLSRKFKTTFEAVSTIKNYLERNYGSFQHKPDFFVYNCCDYPTNNLEYNPQAKNKVRLDVPI